ncbi:MAG: Gfo/Idh/MocA family oxidoreductase [Clostridia bacterium]|nr:Gfo/Idh/MocA family oxidoreductase [Clostridia bacterium]
MKKLKIAIIGCGKRGTGLVRNVLLNMDDVETVALCDLYLDKAETLADLVEERSSLRPLVSTKHTDILNISGLDAVLISTSWETHVPLAIDAMKKGIPTALEVCGAYSIESLWDLVHTWEETQTPFMFMENCCFGKTELLGTSLVRNGLLGEIVHCHGCYGHYLPYEIIPGIEDRHYRLRNYLTRNCENYPTHELGPIAKLLNINRGNQMLSLVSVASKSVGLQDYVRRNAEKYPHLVGKTFAQGDIINTIITCADGSTISLRLDTTLPRSYAREFTVRGTGGLYEQNTNLVYLYGEKEYWETDQYYKDNHNNAARFEKDYLPAAWQEISPEDIERGHGGMDAIEFRVFVDALKNGTEMPIDVYDAAAWMSITALSAMSIAQGGTPQAIPDFTNGMWTVRPPKDVLELPKVSK